MTSNASAIILYYISLVMPSLQYALTLAIIQYTRTHIYYADFHLDYTVRVSFSSRSIFAKRFFRANCPRRETYQLFPSLIFGSGCATRSRLLPVISSRPLPCPDTPEPREAGNSVLHSCSRTDRSLSLIIPWPSTRGRAWSERATLKLS